LLAGVLDVDRVHLIAHPEAPLDDALRSRFEQNVERRAGGEPLQYILGRQEFYGRSFTVAPGVLIPRPETELLVDQVLAKLQTGDRVCDVGAGSGAIAATIALERDDVQVFATDLSRDALTIARRNALSLGAAARLSAGDLLTPFRDASFEVIVSNPPYVAESSREALQRELGFEPAEALFGGPDGLDCYRRLIPQAGQALKAGGWLLLELGYDSLRGVTTLLQQGCWDAPEVFADLAGIPRVVAVRRSAS
jgi:release factor glutamine methyltransferase